jgi:hypothetical protein
MKLTEIRNANAVTPQERASGQAIITVLQLSKILQDKYLYAFSPHFIVGVLAQFLPNIAVLNIKLNIRLHKLI